MRRSLCRAAGKLACPGDKPGTADIEWSEVMRMRWRYAPAAALLAVMAVVLARSEETAQAVRDGLALCAQSVVPALFPFFVLSGLFISMGCAGVLAPALGRLPGVSPAGASAFLLGAVGGYPVGARTVGQLRAAGLCGREEGECLLTCCNNAGPAFIFGVAGLGCFGSLRAGAALYAIHIGSAALVGLLHRRRGGSSAGALPAAIRMRPSQALIDAVQSAAGTMVQVCAFVVFFLTALRLLTGLTGWSHPALLGFFELTNGILRLPPTRAGFVWAAALLGWGGLSVHCVARGSPSARTCAARPCRPPSPPPQPPSPPNGYYKKFSLKNKQKDRPAWPGDPFSGFTEFAHRRARKRSNPFFAAACTPQKALCA